jgi:Secretion system C-terminal sorting domain
VLIGLCGLLCSTSSGVAVYEANTKTVNDIYLRTIAKNNLEAVTTTDKATINYIAAQCPYTGGTAVYVARALQASIRKDTFYNDTENCFAQGINYRVIKPKKEDRIEVGEINVKVFPNPASSFVTIIANQANQTNNTIQFIDVLGRMVSEQIWTSGSNKIIVPTDNLVTGVYQCRIMDSNNTLIAIQKIVIQQP